MKKYLLLFASFVLIAGTSCQKKVDIEKEKEAIMAVIQKESETARDGDIDGLSSCYIHDDLNTRLNLDSESYDIITGWENLAKLLEGVTESVGEGYGGINVSKENAVIKVMGSTAWLICDNIWKGQTVDGELYSESIQITFLEKVDGTWKISFAAWIPKPEPEVAEEPAEETE